MDVNIHKAGTGVIPLAVDDFIGGDGGGLGMYGNDLAIFKINSTGENAGFTYNVYIFNSKHKNTS